MKKSNHNIVIYDRLVEIERKIIQMEKEQKNLENFYLMSKRDNNNIKLLYFALVILYWRKQFCLYIKPFVDRFFSKIMKRYGL